MKIFQLLQDYESFPSYSYFLQEDLIEDQSNESQYIPLTLDESIPEARVVIPAELLQELPTTIINQYIAINSDDDIKLGIVENVFSYFDFKSQLMQEQESLEHSDNVNHEDEAHPSTDQNMDEPRVIEDQQEYENPGERLPDYIDPLKLYQAEIDTSFDDISANQAQMQSEFEQRFFRVYSSSTLFFVSYQDGTVQVYSGDDKLINTYRLIECERFGNQIKVADYTFDFDSLSDLESFCKEIGLKSKSRADLRISKPVDGTLKRLATGNKLLLAETEPIDNQKLSMNVPAELNSKVRNSNESLTTSVPIAPKAKPPVPTRKDKPPVPTRGNSAVSAIKPDVSDTTYKAVDIPARPEVNRAPLPPRVQSMPSTAPEKPSRPIQSIAVEPNLNPVSSVRSSQPEKPARPTPPVVTEDQITTGSKSNNIPPEKPVRPSQTAENIPTGTLSSSSAPENPSGPTHISSVVQDRTSSYNQSSIAPEKPKRPPQNLDSTSTVNSFPPEKPSRPAVPIRVDQLVEAKSAEANAKVENQTKNSDIPPSNSPSLPIRPVMSTSSKTQKNDREPKIASNKLIGSKIAKEKENGEDNASFRKWNDKSNTYSVEAKFLSINNEKVLLQKRTGVKIAVPISKLCNDDLIFLGLKDKAVEAPANDTPVASKSTANKTSIVPVVKKDLELKEQLSVMETYWKSFFIDCLIPESDALSYSSIFNKQKIDKDEVYSLTADNLRALGIPEGHIIKIMKKINSSKFSTNINAAPPSLPTKPQIPDTQILKKEKDLEKKNLEYLDSIFAKKVSKADTSESGRSSVDVQKQIEEDERLARKLQNENPGSTTDLFKAEKVSKNTDTTTDKNRTVRAGAHLSNGNLGNEFPIRFDNAFDSNSAFGTLPKNMVSSIPPRMENSPGTMNSPSSIRRGRASVAGNYAKPPGAMVNNSNIQTQQHQVQAKTAAPEESSRISFPTDFSNTATPVNYGLSGTPSVPGQVGGQNTSDFQNSFVNASINQQVPLSNTVASNAIPSNDSFLQTSSTSNLASANLMNNPQQNFFPVFPSAGMATNASISQQVPLRNTVPNNPIPINQSFPQTTSVNSLSASNLMNNTQPNFLPSFPSSFPDDKRYNSMPSNTNPDLKTMSNSSSQVAFRPDMYGNMAFVNSNPAGQTDTIFNNQRVSNNAQIGQGYVGTNFMNGAKMAPAIGNTEMRPNVSNNMTTVPNYGLGMNPIQGQANSNIFSTQVQSQSHLNSAHMFQQQTVMQQQQQTKPNIAPSNGGQQPFYNPSGQNNSTNVYSSNVSMGLPPTAQMNSVNMNSSNFSASQKARPEFSYTQSNMNSSVIITSPAQNQQQVPLQSQQAFTQSFSNLSIQSNINQPQAQFPQQTSVKQSLPPPLVPVPNQIVPMRVNVSNGDTFVGSGFPATMQQPNVNNSGIFPAQQQQQQQPQLQQQQQAWMNQYYTQQQQRPQFN